MKVVIVGAGVAGLSAAEHLLSSTAADAVDVTVLEAGADWGGRVRTELFADSIVEMGANWIHGACAANPVFTLANREEFGRVDGRKLLRDGEGRMVDMHRRDALYVTPEGTWLSEALGQKVDKIFKEIERKLSTVYDTTTKDSDESILSFLSREFSSACQQHFSQISSLEERQAAEAALWGMVNYLNFHCGDDAALCSARQYGPYEDLPGPQNLRVPGGMRNIFQGLRDRLGEGGLVTGKKVVKVDSTASNSVKVECADGSEYDADAVIVTVSLGYLKKHHMKMFTPPLPTAKVEAIECIGFGRAGKVFLEFDRPFWAWGQGHMSVLKLAWGEERVREGTSSDWTRAILGFDQVVNNPRVLVCWLGGEAVAAMESLDEEEVRARLCALLRSCTGDPTLRAPVRIRRTTWCADELFLGSYSYGGMRTDAPRHQEALAAPDHCGGRVLFAGEATDARWFSTMHGARRSGVREAARVLRKLDEMAS